MTPNQIKLVQTSFAQVAPIAATAADLFYGRLFEIAPQVRAMFPDDLSEQKKKLMAMLGTAVAGLSHLDTLMPAGAARSAAATPATASRPSTMPRSARPCCGPWKRASARPSRPRSRMPGRPPTSSSRRR